MLGRQSFRGSPHFDGVAGGTSDLGGHHTPREVPPTSQWTVSPPRRRAPRSPARRQLTLGHLFSVDDEAFGYLKRVIVTPAVYPGLNDLHHINVQSTGQNTHSVKTLRGYRYAMFRFNSRVPLVRSSSETAVECGRGCGRPHPPSPPLAEGDCPPRCSPSTENKPGV